MKRLEARKTELSRLLASAAEPPPLLHPNMAEIYRQRIDQLYEALQEDAERGKAAEMFRSLVDQVTLMPDDGELAIVLRGDLGAILRFVAGKRDPDTAVPALEVIRGLIERVTVHETSEGVRIDLEGVITALIGLAQGGTTKSPLGSGLDVGSVKVVAGAGSHKYLPLSQADWLDQKSLAA